MKKRLLSLVMILALIMTAIPASIAMAGEQTLPYSIWAMDDLIVGDTYGIYPVSWYEKDLKTPISQSQLRVLLAGVRSKLLKTDEITGSRDYKMPNKKSVTVEDVLGIFYGQLAAYDYSKDLGLMKRYSPSAYMSEYGIFTGKEGELKTKDICTLEQAMVIATRLITSVYDRLDAGSKGFLWEVKKGETKVYLLGSIHIAKYDIYPYSQKLLNAFAESDGLAVELNLLKENGSELILQYGMYQDGSTLKDHVSAETYTRTVELGKMIGYTEEQISYFKPWVLESTFTALSLTNSMPSDEAKVATNLGIDMKFTIDALLTGKPVYEVEGYEKQLTMLDSFSPKLAEYLLNVSIDTAQSALSNQSAAEADFLDTMLQLWKDGDVEGFKEYIVPAMDYESNFDVSEASGKELAKEYKEKFMTNRDLDMAEFIDEMLKNGDGGTYFVILGSAHYISDYSVLDILVKKGYEINQVK